MQHLSSCPRREDPITGSVTRCQALVRFFALRRIKPHAPLLVRVPVNFFRFQPCGRSPQAEYLMRLRRHRGSRYPLHLVFIVYGVDYQCQLQSSISPSPLVFLLISTHSTATLGIPYAPPALKSNSFGSSTEVEPRDYATNLSDHLRTLYAQSFRITLASYVLPRLLARS